MQRDGFGAAVVWFVATPIILILGIMLLRRLTTYQKVPVICFLALIILASPSALFDGIWNIDHSPVGDGRDFLDICASGIHLVVTLVVAYWGLVLIFGSNKARLLALLPLPIYLLLIAYFWGGAFLVNLDQTEAVYIAVSSYLGGRFQVMGIGPDWYGFKDIVLPQVWGQVLVMETTDLVVWALLGFTTWAVKMMGILKFHPNLHVVGLTR